MGALKPPALQHDDGAPGQGALGEADGGRPVEARAVAKLAHQVEEPVEWFNLAGICPGP